MTPEEQLTYWQKQHSAAVERASLWKALAIILMVVLLLVAWRNYSPVVGPCIDGSGTAGCN